MTRIDLLEQLKSVTIAETKDIIMPVRLQKGDAAQEYRAADVHLMRLPDSSAANKKVPYIIHQLITGKDAQAQGEQSSASAIVRSIFCVFNDSSEEEGALMLLNLMERLRIRLLRQVVIGGRYQIDLTTGLESLVYPDDTAPYFKGEMISTWILPAIKREVMTWQ